MEVCFQSENNSIVFCSKSNSCSFYNIQNDKDVCKTQSEKLTPLNPTVPTQIINSVHRPFQTQVWK